jgi:predicted nucleic acid-binding protein
MGGDAGIGRAIALERWPGGPQHCRASVATALPEWRQIERGVATALILTESLRTLDRLRLRASLSDEEVATRRATILRLIASLELVELDEVVLERAAQPMPTELETLDALHLATAVLWREMSRADLVMATHDTALGMAARAHGFPVGGFRAEPRGYVQHRIEAVTTGHGRRSGFAGSYAGLMLWRAWPISRLIPRIAHRFGTEGSVVRIHSPRPPTCARRWSSVALRLTAHAGRPFDGVSNQLNTLRRPSSASLCYTPGSCPSLRLP